MTAAAADPWWADWPKFLPGWLAFVWTLGLGARKVWVRRHRLAVGPDVDAVREAVTGLRSLCYEIIAKQGCMAQWFKEAGHRDAHLPVVDAAGRVADKELKEVLARAAGGWMGLARQAPVAKARVSIVGAPDPPGVRQQRADETRRRKEQVQGAQLIVLALDTALKRLNELERRTVGR